MKVGLLIIAGSMLLVVVMAFVSYRFGQNFWPSQVMARWGKAGIAFFFHGGMWGDFFLLPPLFAYIITQYGASWTLEQVAVMATIGVLVTLGNHLLLIFTQTIPDPFGWKGEKWSALIAMHFVYMSVYVALAGLFYFSPNVSLDAAVGVSIVLGIHMALGTHVVLGVIKLWKQWEKQWEWCPDFFASPILLYMTAGIWVTLSVFSRVAAGSRAGMLVFVIGAFFFSMLTLLVASFREE